VFSLETYHPQTRVADQIQPYHAVPLPRRHLLLGGQAGTLLMQSGFAK
jgi:hypothetical protein